MPTLVSSLIKTALLCVVTFVALSITQDVATASGLAGIMFLPYLWVARLHTALGRGRITRRIRTWGGSETSFRVTGVPELVREDNRFTFYLYWLREAGMCSVVLLLLFGNMLGPALLGWGSGEGPDARSAELAAAYPEGAELAAMSFTPFSAVTIDPQNPEHRIIKSVDGFGMRFASGMPVPASIDQIVDAPLIGRSGQTAAVSRQRAGFASWASFEPMEIAVQDPTAIAYNADEKTLLVFGSQGQVAVIDPAVPGSFESTVSIGQYVHSVVYLDETRGFAALELVDGAQLLHRYSGPNLNLVASVEVRPAINLASGQWVQLKPNGRELLAFVASPVGDDAHRLYALSLDGALSEQPLLSEAALGSILEPGDQLIADQY